jgi:hypothetical protein
MVREALQQSVAVLFVPVDAFSVFGDGSGAPLLPYQVESPSARDDEVFGAMPLPGLVLVFVEGYGQHSLFSTSQWV